MSFFSTSDIFKSILTSDLLKEVVTSKEFVTALKETLDNSGVVNEVTKHVLAHPDVKKGIRKIVLEILADMGIKDEVDKLNIMRGAGCDWDVEDFDHFMSK